MLQHLQLIGNAGFRQRIFQVGEVNNPILLEIPVQTRKTDPSLWTWLYSVFEGPAQDDVKVGDNPIILPILEILVHTTTDYSHLST